MEEEWRPELLVHFVTSVRCAEYRFKQSGEDEGSGVKARVSGVFCDISGMCRI